MFIPLKDQKSANYVKKQLKDLSLQGQTTFQPVFFSRKINQDLKVKEKKPQVVKQQRVVYRFQWNLYDAGYVGCTREHLHVRVDGHKQRSSSMSKHYLDKLDMRRFDIPKKFKNKFDCLVHEILFIRELKTNSQRAIRLYPCFNTLKSISVI